MKKMCVIVLFLMLFSVIAYGTEVEEHRSIGYRIADYLGSKGISEELVIVIISTLPIVELRGAIPVGHLLGMNGFKAYILAVLGNMIPVLPILLLIGPFSRWAMRFKIGKMFFEWLFKRTRKKSASIEKYETIGLTLFVAIPLPVTGAWTGCVAAFLMGTSMKHTILAILFGVMISGIIMTVLSVLGRWGALIAGVALLTLAALTVWRILKGEEKHHDLTVDCLAQETTESAEE